MLNRDVVLEGAGIVDIEQLQLLAGGQSATASEQQMARIAAKGWLETVGEVHLITITGRTLLERRPQGIRQ